MGPCRQRPEEIENLLDSSVTGAACRLEVFSKRRNTGKRKSSQGKSKVFILEGDGNFEPLGLNKLFERMKMFCSENCTCLLQREELVPV